MPPMGTQSVVDRLAELAIERPDDTAFIFVQDRHLNDEKVTYGELWNRVKNVSMLLAERGCQHGDRAILIYPSGLPYIIAFFGCLAAGVIAVPVYPPASEQHLERLRRVISDCDPAVLLTETSEIAVLERISTELDCVNFHLCCTDQLASPPSVLSHEVHHCHATDVALLQYTSGSTGSPKGVIVTHGNLVANQRFITQAFSGNCAGSVLGWLPLYHDMGLIGCVIQSIFWGYSYVFMSPLTFLQNPVVWLKAITKYRALRSGGPNFAYDLCASKVRDEQMENIDLSGWRIAFCGSEQIRPASLRRFAERFMAVGFDPKNFLPCYGLAEATLFVSGSQYPNGPELRSPLSSSHSKVTDSLQTFVGCGHVPEEIDVRIVDPESLVELSEGQIGEIWVHGANVAHGYWNKPELTHTTFHAHIANHQNSLDYLRTGDLGFLRGRELIITGRLKEVLIVGGRNIYPQDIETLVESQNPAFRTGHTAAVMVPGENTERIAIVAEIERTYRNKVDWNSLSERIVSAVVKAYGVAPHSLVFLSPGRQLKTSSGKLRRSEIGKQLAAGKLSALHTWPSFGAQEDTITINNQKTFK